MSARTASVMLSFAALLLADSTKLRAASLTSELRMDSEVEGLGIAHFEGDNQLGILYFDDRGYNSIMTVDRLAALYDVASGGRLILGVARGTFREGAATQDKVSLFSPGGVIVATGLRTLPLLAAVSVRGDKVAALFRNRGTGRVSLQAGDAAWVNPSEVYFKTFGKNDSAGGANTYNGESFSWSPDADHIVYSLDGEIYIFDAVTHSKRSVIAGSDPAWSPDGRFIAFRNANHELALYDVSNGRPRSLVSNMKVTGFPRWSPDGKYILFTRFSVLLALRNPLTMPATDFMVVRVGDGATTAVFTPGMGLENRGFYWIVTGGRSEPRK